MKLLAWLVRICLFLVFFAFALLNTSLVKLNYVLGEWQAPLALVLLAFFIAGVLLGITVILPSVFRYRRDLKKAKSALPVVQEVNFPPAA